MNRKLATAIDLGRLMGNYSDGWTFMQVIQKIRRIATRYHRLCEYDYNGEGWLNGKLYRADHEGYLDKNENSIWYNELEKLDKQLDKFSNACNMKIETQRDPRGWEVKLFYKGMDISELIH
jgi:hypothetical protein